MAALVSSNDHIRPLLDAVDRLRLLNVMKEGIQLPTIVVVGDESSGKSGVLESISGIRLPCGQSISTRVPLILRLQNDSADDSLLQLEYQGRVVHTSESDLADAIILATTEISGANKGVSDVPLTLFVKKKGIPDLTLVDLPCITRNPVDGQPEDIYEQISGIIMKYIAPKESIILNVLSACVNFSTCASIRMSQRVDESGERTIAVVTEADRAPEGLLEKVNYEDIKIGFGYVCLRSRMGNETYEEAQEEEAKLFRENPFLSSIDKSIVGISVLAQKLTQIQAAIMEKYLPDISKQIGEKLNYSTAELEQFPENLSTQAGPMLAFMGIMSAVQQSLTKLFLFGACEEFPDENEMEPSIPISDMFDDFFKNLAKWSDPTDKFLMEEIGVLEKAKGIVLPGFFPRTAFRTIMNRKLKSIADSVHLFLAGVWDYVEKVVARVLLVQTQKFPKLQSSIRIVAQNVLVKMRKRSVASVKKDIEMEMAVDYTSNPDYTKIFESIHESRSAFEDALYGSRDLTEVDDPDLTGCVEIKGLGTVRVGHLRPHRDLAVQAFVLRARLVAYWKCVVQRLVDGMMLDMVYNIKCLVEKEMEEQIVSNNVGEDKVGLETLFEFPAIRANRERLLQSIELLKESKGVLASISHLVYKAC